MDVQTQRQAMKFFGGEKLNLKNFLHFVREAAT